MAEQHKQIHIPDGIVFGRKVAVVPSVSMSFSHSGRMAEQGRINEGYTWIDRGSDLGRYIIEVDRVDVPVLKHFIGTEPRSISIPAPVSGLLIHASYELDSGLTAILLPDDEPESESGEYMFRALCQLCVDYKRYFLKPSRYWTQNGWPEERFSKVMAEQLTQKVEYVDALPNYKDYFDEARTKYPNLRPHLKHLV